MSTAPEPGFIRVACTECNNPDVWFKCNECGKSDHFVKLDDHVRCDCSATYTTGICTCGATVPFDQLHAVAHDQGPLALADLEIAWERVALLVLGGIVIVSTIVFFLMGA